MKFTKTSKLLILSVVATVFGQAMYAQNTVQALMPGPAASGTYRSHAWIAIVVDPSAVVHGPGNSCGVASGNICYYKASDLQTAYAIGSIAHSNGGAGMTVGIVDAYYNSQTEADFASSNTFHGLPSCTIASGCLTIVSQTGTTCPTGCTANPATTTGRGWAGETNLDLAAVHSIAPNAKILLVTGNSPSFSDLGTGVLYAQANADVVTNSYGSNEGAGESSFDTFYSGSSVPILFSSGDTGAVTEYPCTSSYALCVGGTRLLTTATSFRNVESAWGGSDTSGGGGGGCSSQIVAPAFESAFSTCAPFRGVPDVAALADPYTGLAVFLGTFAGNGSAGVYVIGGTSLASPLMAGVVANIDADRGFNGKARLGANLNALVYQAASASYRYRFYDVTTGTTGFGATTGWDKATGLGVMLGPALAVYLITLP